MYIDHASSDVVMLATCASSAANLASMMAKYCAIMVVLAGMPNASGDCSCVVANGMLCRLPGVNGIVLPCVD